MTLALDPQSTTRIKGAAMLLLIAHNFQYLVSDLPGVNEFCFDIKNVEAVLRAISNTPLQSIQLIVGFAGHYAAPVFIFLSGYGLTERYSHTPLRYRTFVMRRLVRIYPTFILAIVLWILSRGWAAGPYAFAMQHGKSILLKLALISNWVPGEQLSLVGPWWFFPLVFQLYLVFPFLVRMNPKELLLVASAGFFLSAAFNEFSGRTGYLYATPLGHLPEFCLGLWFSKKRTSSISWAVMGVGALLLLLGNWFALVWYPTHVSSVLVLLGTWERASALLSRWFFLDRALAFVGSLSFELFLVNGFLREPFLSWARESGPGIPHIFMGSLSLLVCLFTALVLQRIVDRLNVPNRWRWRLPPKQT